MKFTIAPLRNSYIIDTEDDEWDFDMVWRSQMCWFSPGKKVLIMDEDGNMEIFTKGDSSFE